MKKNSNPAFKLLIILVSSGLCLCHCNRVKPVQQSRQDQVIQNHDSTSLFNGRTLEGWEITNFGPQGPVYVSDGRIILSMGDGCTGITWKGKFPDIGYILSIDAMKLEGNDFFCGVTFPVHGDPCTLIVGGWGGTTVGLSNIDGKDASENETTTLRKFETGRWYHIRIAVTEEYIRAWIDDDKVVDFSTDGKKLSVRPEVELSRPFGIASWRTTAAVRNIKVDKYAAKDHHPGS
jgi:hypothetical protein